MSSTALLRDAYRELDETGSLSRHTRNTLLHAGTDPALLIAADAALTEEDI